jgi:hypothetical protein
MINSRRNRWARLVARKGKKMNASDFLVSQPEGKRQVGKPRRRLVISSKIYRRKIW